MGNLGPLQLPWCPVPSPVPSFSCSPVWSSTFWTHCALHSVTVNQLSMPNLAIKFVIISCSDPFYSCRYFCFCADSEENRGRFCRSNEIPMNVVTHTPPLSSHLVYLYLKFLSRCSTAARLLPGNQTSFNLKCHLVACFQLTLSRELSWAGLNVYLFVKTCPSINNKSWISQVCFACVVLWKCEGVLAMYEEAEQNQTRCLLLRNKHSCDGAHCRRGVGYESSRAGAGSCWAHALLRRRT